jgi:hypothetical protein
MHVGIWLQPGRYGIRFSALQIGQLGKFDATTLLLQVTTSLSLIALSTLIVDYAAIYLLADKSRYKAAKYEYVANFLLICICADVLNFSDFV